jgi:hypothetical protein
MHVRPPKGHQSSAEWLVLLLAGRRELAAAAKVSIDTVARFERGDELKERTIEALQRALEAAGIEFMDGNGGGPGVRLSGKPKRETRKK